MQKVKNMVKLSANLSMMFTEVPFLERFGAAAKAGFEAVEFLFPYAFEPQEIGCRVKDNALQISVFNLYPGDWDAGDRGLAAVSGREDEFQRAVKQALPYALATGAKRVHVMAGVAEATAIATETHINNIRHAADAMVEHGIYVLIEPINAGDMPGYFLSRTDQALDLINRIDRPNVRLQFDIYHHEITHGDVIPVLKQIMPHVAHIQIAGVPGRHEPDTGDLDYGLVFETLDQLNYTGWVGCEYRPKGDTTAGLLWRQALGLSCSDCANLHQIPLAETGNTGGKRSER